MLFSLTTFSTNLSLLSTNPTDSCLYLFDLLCTLVGLSVLDPVLDKLDILDIFDIPDILGLKGGFPFSGSLVGDWNVRN